MVTLTSIAQDPDPPVSQTGTTPVIVADGTTTITTLAHNFVADNQITLNEAKIESFENLGLGEGIVFGIDYTVTTDPTIQLKSLIAGTNVSLSSDDDTITINSISSEVFDWTADHDTMGNELVSTVNNLSFDANMNEPSIIFKLEGAVYFAINPTNAFFNSGILTIEDKFGTGNGELELVAGSDNDSAGDEIGDIHAFAQDSGGDVVEYAEIEFFIEDPVLATLAGGMHLNVWVDGEETSFIKINEDNNNRVNLLFDTDFEGNSILSGNIDVVEDFISSFSGLTTGVTTYTNNESLTITGQTSGTNNAVAIMTLDGSNQIKSINFTDRGAGYTDGETVNIVGNTSGEDTTATISTTTSITSFTTNNIDDFNLSGLDTGDILYWDGNDFVNLGAGTGGQVLTSNGTSSSPSWQTGGGGATSLNDLSDVTIDTISNAQILIYDGTTDNVFENVTISGDVTISNTGVITIDSSFATSSDTLDFFSATTSAELASVISDETGSGLLVFNDTPTLKSPLINDDNDNEMVRFLTHASSVHYFTITNTDNPTISVTGDTNVGMHINSLGTGLVTINSKFRFGSTELSLATNSQITLNKEDIVGSESTDIINSSTTYGWHLATNTLPIFLDANDIYIPASSRIYFDGGNETYIEEESDDVLKITVGNRLGLTIEDNGSINFVAGETTVLSSTTNNGFFYIPTIDDEPTGTPHTYGASAAIVFDSTNNEFYIYDDNWHQISGGGSSTLIGLDDVNVSGLSSGDVLSYNGFDWVNDSDVPRTTDKLSVFASTTSTELASVISDETGSGSLVFGNTPTLTTPTIGDFTNAVHDHEDSSGGGQLTATDSLDATGTTDSTTFLRGDNTWAVPSASTSFIGFTADANLNMGEFDITDGSDISLTKTGTTRFINFERDEDLAGFAEIGIIDFKAQDGLGALQSYAQIQGKMVRDTDGNEAGGFEFSIMNSGTPDDRILTLTGGISTEDFASIYATLNMESNEINNITSLEINSYLSFNGNTNTQSIQGDTDGLTFTVPTGDGFDYVTNSNTVFEVANDLGSVIIGQQTALATTATDGFLYIPSSGGTPTGIPTGYTGKIPLEYDSTNDLLYIYNSGWKSIGGLTIATSSGTHVHADNTTEQDVIEITTNLDNVEVSLDMTEFTQDTTVRFYEKMDDTNYIEVSQATYPGDFTADGTVFVMNGKGQDQKITFQSTITEGASRNSDWAQVNLVRTE